MVILLHNNSKREEPLCQQGQRYVQHLIMFPGYKFVMVPDYTVPVLPPPQVPPVIVQQQAVPRAPAAPYSKKSKKVTFKEPPFIGPLWVNGSRNYTPPFIGPLHKMGTHGPIANNLSGGTPSQMDLESTIPFGVTPENLARARGIKNLRNFPELAFDSPEDLAGGPMPLSVSFNEPVTPRGFKPARPSEQLVRVEQFAPEYRTRLYKPMVRPLRDMMTRARAKRRGARNREKAENLQNKPYLM